MNGHINLHLYSRSYEENFDSTVGVLILMLPQLAEGGLRNLRKQVAYIVWLGMGRLRVRTKKKDVPISLIREICAKWGEV